MRILKIKTKTGIKTVYNVIDWGWNAETGDLYYRSGKELHHKAERYKELKKEIDKLYEELEEFANENGFEDFWIDGFGVSQEPNGEEQTDGEYCDQWMRGEDSGDGIYYYPIEGSTQYFWVAYSF